MAFCELRYFSPALQKQTAANVILPDREAGPGPYPVLYLLHGLSDDHTIWHRRTSIERYVAGLPLIVAMPDGGRGFYADAVQGFAYETAIAGDLVQLIDGAFKTRPVREGRAVAGLSMGGYGALRYALRRPDLFCAAVSHSGALLFGHRALPGPESGNPEFARILGESPVGGPNDLCAVAAALPSEQRPALRIDCGVDDFLLEDNRAFHAHLDEIGYPHEYAEFPGSHEWGYWDTHVQEAVRFVMARLRG